MEIVTLVIAVYAAAVATGGLLWQVHLHRRRTGSIVNVTVRHHVEPEQWGELELGARLQYALTVTAVNRGDTEEHVAHLAIESAAEPVRVSDDERDRPLPPKGRVSSEFRLPQASLNLREGFYGVAQLASGVEVRSSLQHLDPGHLEEVGSRRVPRP